MNKLTNAKNGFSLLELLIVLVIVGILATLAWPNYQQYAQRTRRVDAQRMLLELRQAMERGYSASYSYASAAAAIFPVPQPPEGYNISSDATVLTASTYRLVATPAANGPQASDPCGTLSITQSGVKQVSASTVAECW